MILNKMNKMNNSDNPMIFNLNDQMGNNFNNELNRSSQYSNYQQTATTTASFSRSNIFQDHESSFKNE